MTEGEVDDPWVRTLAMKLRSWYDGEPVSGLRGQGDAALERRLAQRLAELQAIGAGRYRVEAVIAEGGMGQVVAAVDTVAGRTVAIKRAIGSDDATEAVSRKLRLLAEAATIARLQHPGVVPLYDVGVDAEGEPFFAMPRVAGVSFADLLAGAAERDVDRALARRVEILRRTGETMAYAHAQGVVHRDLKPANVMVGTYGEVYVMDWGLAADEGLPVAAPVDDGSSSKASPSLTRSGNVMGTPAYMAPERVAAGGSATAAADVYGLGAILYQVLTGAPPYATEREEWSADTILAAIRERPPLPVLVVAPGVDHELAAICARAMQRTPAERYADMHEFVADLRAWSEHRVVRAHGAGVVVHVRKWVRRNRALAAVLVAAAALFVTIGTWFVARLAEARDAAMVAAVAAERNLAEILDLAVAERVAALRRRAEVDLWPLSPTIEGELLAWLEEAEALRPALVRLRERREVVSVANVPTSEAAADVQWRRRLLDTAIRALEEFFAPLPGQGPELPLDSTVAAITVRVTRARELARATIGEQAAKELWRRTAAEVKRLDVYRGLELLPQPGLVPIGRDPVSGLHEFAHVQSGSVPRRDTSGQLSTRDDDGVVLVLLPGGEAWIGASPDDPRHPDPLAETINEQPVHRVELAPFFLAKFETTQAQWLRVTGDSPSVHTVASDFVDERAPRHPVESVDWFTARMVARKMGLQLPTEAQWEHAARAGTTTPWYTGATIGTLLQPPAGNLADAGSARALGTAGWTPTPGLDDGFVMHAPVGSYAPNAFGLYDMLGNVAEWCADEYVSYAEEPLPGTGGRPLGDTPRTAMYRGGAFDQPAQEARSANRAGGPPTRRHFALGIRFARQLDR